ncbi:MAG: rhodanese-like domain-containing protein [Planctomycetota bacterium]
MSFALRTSIEVAAMLLVSVALAFAGNSLIKNPVDLSRNYYRGSVSTAAAIDATEHVSKPADPTPAPEQPVSVEAPMPSSATPPTDHAPATKLGDYELIDLEEVKAFADEDVEFAIIVDARKHDTYEKGHIPGAYSLDFYRLNKEMIDAMRDKLDAAAIIVLYCNGGNCEDSLNLAASLEYDYQVERAKLRVFEAGYEAWEKAKYSIVTGGERR